MKKIFTLLLTITVLMGCSDEKNALTESGEACTTCKGFKEYVQEENLAVKTSKIIIDNTSYDLEYVRDQKYNGKDFCYGHLLVDQTTFGNVLYSFTSNYSITKAWEIKLLGGNKNICAEQSINKSDIKYAIVYYKDNNNYAFVDFINLATNAKQTFQIGDVYFSVAAYLLMEKAGIANNPSIISIRNKDFNNAGVLFNKDKDFVCRVAAPQPNTIQHVDPSLDSGAGCPGNCVGPQSECTSIPGTTCADWWNPCPSNNIVRSLYADASYQSLSVDLFNKYTVMHSFRDFLTHYSKGKQYIIDYYAIGKLMDSGMVNVSINTKILVATTIISHSNKLNMLLNNSTYGSSVLYTIPEANQYIDVLNKLKNESSNASWNQLLNNAIVDVNTFKGKTVSNVLLGWQ